MTNIIRFSERGNPRRYTIQLTQNPINEFHQHMLDTISNRHIRFRPRQRRYAIFSRDAPPNLIDMIADLTSQEQTNTAAHSIDTIPVYTAEGDLTECTICQDKIKKGDAFRRLPCGITVNHCFHKECIDPWLANNTTCPNCRSDIRA